MALDTPPILQVAAKAAIVNSQSLVLIARESAADKNNTKVGTFGLIGGRLEPGESFEDGLRREILEETGLQVTPIEPIYLGEWRPIIQGVPHQIIAVFMKCEVSDEQVVRISNEHDEFLWIDPAKRHDYPIMEPDCFVIDKLV